ncbi:MAG TPA: hypothetical protein PLY23_09065 [Alphaproteobacteria bacterium]|nr:hypothetical protein [Alphaproteobacteria bacterium]HQS94763.1 hypothetical protein [Alphaproteobacteria bacterium]
MKFLTVTLKSLIFIGILFCVQTGSAMLLNIPEEDHVYQTLTKTLNAPWETVAQNPELRRDFLVQLQTSEISSLYPMRSYLTKIGKEARFDNEVWMVLFKNGLKAVFKPKTEEERENALGERVAYDCAEFIAKTTGYCLVPPTTTREIHGFTGSLQWFIESPYDLWKDTDHTPFFKKLPLNLKDLTSHFLFVFGQWDQHPGNYMGIPSELNLGTTLVGLIDNEGIVNAQIIPPLGRPYVRVSYEKDQDLQDSGALVLAGSISLKTLKSIFGDKVPEGHLKSIYHTFFGDDDKTQDASRSLSYILKDGFPWIQYHAHNQKAFPLAKKLSGKAKESYELLTLPILSALFKPLTDFNPNRFSDLFLQSVLERRDMLMTRFSLSVKQNPDPFAKV